MTDARDKPRRLQTATERDVQSARARAERLAAVPAEVDEDEDLTGRYEGEELQRRRAERSDASRIGHLEESNDELRKDHRELVKAVNVIAVSHAENTGKLDTLVELAAAAAVEREKRAKAEAEERESRAKAEVELAKANAAERESKRKYIVPIIRAVGIALALVVAALIGRG